MIFTVPEPEMTPIELGPVTVMFGSPDTFTVLVIATLSRLRVVPGSSVNGAVPRALLFCSDSVPLVTVVPPVKLLAPDRVAVFEPPSIVSEPEPVKTFE